MENREKLSHGLLKSHKGDFDPRPGGAVPAPRGPYQVRRKDRFYSKPLARRSSEFGRKTCVPCIVLAHTLYAQT